MPIKIIIIIIIIILLLYTLPYFYLRIKHNFWFYQPVSHYYNLLLPRGYITSTIPKIYDNKNYHITNIDITDDKLIKLWLLLLKNSYIPIKNDYVSYHISSSFLLWSLGTQLDKYILLSITKDNKLIGTITSREINIQINNNQLQLLYVDYLCVDSNHRKNGLAQMLISNMAHAGLKKNYRAFIFKKEIYPLPYHYICNYMTHIININDINDNISFKKANINYKYVLLTEKSSQKEIEDCFVYYQNHSHKFKLYQSYNLEEFIFYFISSKHTYSYCIYDTSNGSISGLVILFDSQFEYNKQKSLELYLYLREEENNFNIIFHILTSLNHKYSYIYIPDIGYNNEILDNISNLKTDEGNMNYIHLYNYHEYKLNPRDIILSFF